MESIEEKVLELEDKVLSLETTIDYLEGEITLKINEDKVISAINTSPAGTRIKADKIQIDGDTLIEDSTFKGKELSTSYNLGTKLSDWKKVN
jgi:hypothetical protein